MKDLVDPEVIERAAAGCRKAFAAIIGAYYDAIYRMAWRWLGTREEAEDVAQDVCVRLAGAIASFRGEAGFATWLYRLTYNVAIDHLRARKRSRRSNDPNVVALFPQLDERSPDTGMIEGDLWNEVRRLPPQQRDAILLVYGEDLSHVNAAQIMGCSEKTVSWHLHEARKRLRERLEAVG